MTTTPTRETVEDVILGRFNEMWIEPTNGPTSIVGYVPQVHWPDREETGIPPLDKHWCRYVFQTTSRVQRTFRGPYGTRWQGNGNVIVEHFFSKLTLEAGDNTRILGYAEDIYIEPALNGCIWFREPRTIEVEAEENWFRGNTSAQWEYDQIIT